MGSRHLRCSVVLPLRGAVTSGPFTSLAKGIAVLLRLNILRKLIASLALLSLAPLHAVAEFRPTLFVEGIGGAALGLDHDDPIDFHPMDPHAPFNFGSGTAFRAAVSFLYVGYSNVLANSRANNEEVEHKTYSIGISIREKDYRSEFAVPYYDMALGIGHSQVALSDGRKSYHGLVELQGSLGVVFWDTLSVGVGATIRTLGYPGETAAFSASPYITAGIWFF